MKFKLFLPFATVTTVAASIFAVSNGAQAAVIAPPGSEIDLASVGPLYYTQNALDFTSTQNSVPTPGVVGEASVVTTTGYFASASPPIGSQVQMFDLFGTPGVAFTSGSQNNLSSPTKLIDFGNGSPTGNGTSFYATSVTPSINPVTNAISYKFGGYFLNGTDQTSATVSLLSGQQNTPLGSTAVLNSLSALTQANSGRTSYSMTLIAGPAITGVPESSTLAGIVMFGLMGVGAVARRTRTSRI
jgi:hypothetical protein